MSIRHLDKIFHPKRIALLDASDAPQSKSAIVLRNLIVEGCKHVVYPVNPERESIHGIQAYPDVASLPRTPDLAVVCGEAETVADAVAECGKADIPGMVILSSGFSEAGEEGRALEQRVREEAFNYPRMRILGPNSFGVIVPGSQLNVSLSSGMPRCGNVAFLSQSKAICASTLDWAIKEQVGFSFFVSLGNGLDIGFDSLIDYFGNDAKTLALMLYVLSIGNVREFMSAARAFARSKPIVAYKSGRFVESAEAAASHTGKMAGEDAVYDAAFERAGIVRVTQIAELFDCAELLARQRTPGSDKLGIITNAGEPAAVAADALLARHGRLAVPGADTLEELKPLLQPNRVPGNPVNLRRDATPKQYELATKAMLADKNVNAALVILTPRMATDPTGVAKAISQVAMRASKPVLAAWMGGHTVQDGIASLNRNGVPAFDTPEKAIRAFTYLVSFARNKEVLYETPRDIPVSFIPHRDEVKQIALDHEHEILTECLSKELLSTYEIPVAQPHIARSSEEAVEIARRIGYPVVLKILSPQITHKTDVRGVVLNLTTDEGVHAHFDRILRSAREHHPDAHLEGVTVQSMVVAPNGIELILGTKTDPTFGSVIMVGLGGTVTEVIHDRAIGLPPLNERLTRRMLESLKAWPLLLGYRSKPRVNIDRLIEIVMRLSYLAADVPEVRELDINPLLVTPADVIALDARVRIARREATANARPYSHLAIRPYPDECRRAETLKDGTPVLLRPIRPEDEPRWQALLTRCSDESIRLRFHTSLKRGSHEVATRYCFIDYDRDMTIVAETQIDGTPHLIGVANLFSDPFRESAEYAVLVADQWQRRGLGELFTAYCVQIAKGWGLNTVYAESAPSNAGMIALFKKHGFEITQRDNDGSFLLTKTLG